jgi:hypothetical protein
LASVSDSVVVLTFERVSGGHSVGEPPLFRAHAESEWGTDVTSQDILVSVSLDDALPHFEGEPLRR